MWFVWGLISGVVITAICLLFSAFVLAALAEAFRIDKRAGTIIGAIFWLVVLIIMVMNYGQELKEHSELVPGFIVGGISTLVFAFKSIKS